MNKNIQGALTAFALVLAAASHAQTRTALIRITDYVGPGSVVMDELTTPLLHYARTGEMFQTRMIAGSAQGSFPENIRRVYNTFLYASTFGPDEFRRAETKGQLDAYMLARAEALKDAGVYLFRVKGRLLEYDFTRKGFPVELSLPDSLVRSRETLACLGNHSLIAVNKQQQAPAAACLSAPNLAAQQSLRFLEVPDLESAKLLRQKTPYGLDYYVVAQVSADYRAFKAPLPKLTDGRAVLGIQTTRAIGLLMADHYASTVLAKSGVTDTRELLAMSTRQPQDAAQTGQLVQPVQADAAKPAAAAPRTMEVVDESRQTPQSLATQAAPSEAKEPAALQAASSLNPDSARTPAAAPGGSQAVALGLPQDPENQNLDKLLATLSWAVYSDAAKLRAAQQGIAKLTGKHERVSVDAGREPTLKKLELSELSKELEARKVKLAELQQQEQIKREASARYGLHPVAAPVYERIHQEVYRFNDGRHLVVFRGTDNTDDVMTDAQLALNDETVAEVRRRMRQSVGGRITGALGGVAGAAMGGSTVPTSFLSADKMVATLIRSGVPASKIILTGHSLGGGLAQYAGFKNDVQAVVSFNPAPLSMTLREQAKISATSKTVAHHYISLLMDDRGDLRLDPVSGKLQGIAGLPELWTLQIVGKTRAMQVCNGLNTPEFALALNAVDKAVAGTAVKAAGAGAGSAKEKVARMYGAAGGLALAKTERTHAAETAADVGDKAATGLLAAKRCIDHPILCPLAAAGTLVTMEAAREKRKAMWLLLQAHAMRPLYESIVADGAPTCAASNAQHQPLPTN